MSSGLRNRLPAQAGLEMLAEGGSAVDAALAAAVTLTLVEPVSNGIGSAAFAGLSRVAWNFGGGPVSIRLRSPQHCVRRVRQIGRSRVPSLLGALVGAGDR
jgi:Gamma-glutamyltranspeptidase